MITNLQTALFIHQPKSMVEMLAHALIVEKANAILKENQTKEDKILKTIKVSETLITEIFVIPCRNCGKYHHSNYCCGTRRKCYNCGKLRHFSRVSGCSVRLSYRNFINSREYIHVVQTGMPREDGQRSNFRTERRKCPPPIPRISNRKDRHVVMDTI